MLAVTQVVLLVITNKSKSCQLLGALGKRYVEAKNKASLLRLAKDVAFLFPLTSHHYDADCVVALHGKICQSQFCYPLSCEHGFYDMLTVCPN